jgi:outer membrane protein OmpA-like peptidoglycan-associated protein
MRIRQLSINSILFLNREKIFETFEQRHNNRHSVSVVRKVFGTVKRTLLWFFLLAAVSVGSGVASSEYTFANEVTEDYHNYRILPPPNPREEIAMKDVFFDFNSFNIKESAKAVLKENAEFLKRNPDVVVLIQGYCDSKENTSENLGFKRANEVISYIVKQGVDPQRVNSIDKCDESYVGLTTDESPWNLDRFVHFIPFRTEKRALDVAVY